MRAVLFRLSREGMALYMLASSEWEVASGAAIGKRETVAQFRGSRFISNQLEFRGRKIALQSQHS